VSASGYGVGVPPTEGSEWAAHALERLSSAGYRRGGARRAVVELLGRQRCARSVQDLEQALRESGRSVGRASIYRVLDQLEQLRLVDRLEVGQGQALYEPHLPSGEHHHHLVCDDCGRVVPFEDPALERAIARLSERVKFSVDDHDVVLRGSCGACR
jgi:Fur family transcriptional regulator, ferric uptake regulator